MVCLDTCFIIDLLKGNEKIKLLKQEFDKTSESITVSSPSLIELMKGLRIGNPSENEEEKINNLISSLSILNLDKKSAMLSGEIEAYLIKKGQLIDLEDLMIASICICNHEKLITRNEKHFKRIKNLEIETY